MHLTAANQSTPTGGARAVAFDAFPAGMIGGIEVTKSLTPELDAEGIGGSVNLLPLSLPPGGGPLVAASLAAGQETLRHTGVYEGDLTLGNSFAIPGVDNFVNPKPFSLILNYSLHSDRRGIDDVEEDYINSAADGPGPNPVSDLQFRRYNTHRVTQGFGGEFDFDPTPTTHIYLRGLEGGYDEQQDKNRLQLDALDGSGGALADNGGGNYTATGATAEKDFTNSNERIFYQLAAIGGRTVIADTVNVDVRASWTQGADITPRSYGTTFTYNGAPFTVNYNTASSSYRTYVAPGVDLSNPANFSLSSASNTPGRTIDAEFGTGADASFADNLFGNIGEAKFGLAARFRTEGAYQVEYDYNNLNTNATLAQLDGGNPNIVYYNSHYSIGPDVGYRALFPQLGAPTNNIASNLTSYAHNSENIYAAYGQETLDVGALELLGGARVEDTNGTYRAYLAATDAAGNTTYAPNTNKQDYLNIFPSLQAKYTVNDRLQFRAAWSTAIARPGFQQISAADSVDRSQSPIAVTQGNPSLKPTTENAFDLTAEYYTRHDGLLLVNPFYKYLNNYTVSTLTNGTYQGAPAQITGYENIGGAFVRGVEVEAQQKLTMLPAPFDGFGAEGNVTFVDSRGRYDNGNSGTGGGAQKANQLPETSPLTYNAALFYEKGPIGVRLAATYVSRNLFTVGGTRDTDQFSQPRFRLDVDASYQITPQWQIFAQGKNLTSTKLEFTQSASTAYPIQREIYQQDFLAGVRYNFGGGPSGGGADTGGSDD